jgi:hypothetical protein
MSEKRKKKQNKEIFPTIIFTKLKLNTYKKILTLSLSISN